MTAGSLPRLCRPNFLVLPSAVGSGRSWRAESPQRRETLRRSKETASEECVSPTLLLHPSPPFLSLPSLIIASMMPAMEPDRRELSVRIPAASPRVNR
ncbi:hypothetical protein L209DRAFT_748647 [Thermothelomyces heterothallicus CBS 203.75]